jgi:hypothetical protein
LRFNKALGGSAMLFTCSRVTRFNQLVFAVLCVGIVDAPARAAFDLFSIGGDTTTASIQPTVDAFRAALGDPNNGNNAGPLASGRREINWDGGGATMAASSGTPFTGFQNSRGATFTTPGTGFTQTPLTDVALTGIQAGYATTFNTFSPQRIFTPLGSNITDVTFSLPGSGGATQATVAGFGAVFSDVDLVNTTTIELFNVANTSLGVFNVLPGTASTAPGRGLSFLGLLANAGERIARVQITTGNQALGLADSNGNPVDVVVMDDFLYSEAVLIPEPASATLAALAIAGALIHAARRQV